MDQEEPQGTDSESSSPEIPNTSDSVPTSLPDVSETINEEALEHGKNLFFQSFEVFKNIQRKNTKLEKDLAESKQRNQFLDRECLQYVSITKKLLKKHEICMAQFKAIISARLYWSLDIPGAIFRETFSVTNLPI